MLEPSALALSSVAGPLGTLSSPRVLQCWIWSF